MAPLNTVRGSGFRAVMKVSDARRIWLGRKGTASVGSELIRTEGSTGRILAENVTASVDVPRFDRSAVDGYAVNAEDTFGASPTNLISLDLMGSIPITGPADLVVKRGEAVEVTTGSPLPQGCDAVVMLEYGKSEARRLELFAQVAPCENVTRRGDDIRRGALLFEKGHRVIPTDIGVLKAVGKDYIAVAKRPRVALFSTGDELVEKLEEASDYQIVNVNGPILAALVREAGGIPVELGITRDDEAEIKRKIQEAHSSADLIAITGGTSVGPKDTLPEVIRSFQRSGITVHGIAMRPGMPTALGYLDGKPLVVAPGNPVAAVIAFLIFIKPQIALMMGSHPEEPPRIPATLNRRVATRAGFRYFVRVHVSKKDGEYRADPVMTLGSGILSSMARANGILEVPEEREGYEAGESVAVTVYRSLLGGE